MASYLVETADVETASETYAQRFAGRVGEWMLELQARLTLQLLEGMEGASILDVGGGHGQLAGPLIQHGFRVTVLGSSPVCVNRIRDLVESGQCRFVVGNPLALPFDDQSFDVVISFRLLSHCLHWPLLIRELCRVAKRCVALDYPTTQSLNVISPILFRLKRWIEKSTREWIQFRHAQIIAEFRRNGFRLGARRKEFFLPVVLHRVMDNHRVSVILEAIFRRLGLTALWGSPVIVRMDRISSSSQIPAP